MAVGGAVMIRCIFCLQVYGPIARRGGWELISKGGGRRGAYKLQFTLYI